MDIPPPRWPVVARDAELVQLRERLGQALAGRGSLVLVGGEPGIGKTTLTEELLREARAKNAYCVRGSCYDMEGAIPYAPFVETLEHGMRTVPLPDLRLVLGDAAPEIATLVPELRQHFPDIPAPMQLPPEQQRRVLFNAYREFMARACRRGPLVYVFEDLHWADEPTLLLLEHLAPALSSLPMLVIGTYRDVELDVGRPFARVMETLARKQLATRIVLRRLPEAGVAQMLATMSRQPPPDSLVRTIHAETEGNPFFVAEVYQHLLEEGRLLGPDGAFRDDLGVGDVDVPEGVRLVIGRRLERLSEQARRTLTVAALVGRTFSVRLLEPLADLGEEALLTALEQAERAQLIAPLADHREPRYSFTHELIRQTLVQGLSLPRRQKLHARIAAAIESAYAASLDRHAAAMAHHLYQAGALVEAERATRWLLVAADSALSCAAIEEALARLDEAILVNEQGPDSVVADLHWRKALSLRRIERGDAAADALRAALRHFERAGDRRGVTAATSLLVETLVWHTTESRGLIDALEELTATVPSDGGRCAATYGLAMAMAQSGAAVDATSALERARLIASTLDDTEKESVASWAATTEALAGYLMGQPERVIEHAPAARVQWRGADSVRHVAAVDVHWGVALIVTCRLDEARRFLAGARSNAGRVQNSTLTALLGFAASWLSSLGGDFETAEKEALASMPEGGAPAQVWINAGAALALGRVAFMRGRAEQAMAHLLRAAEGERHTAFRGRSEAFQALVLAESGDREGAIEVLRGPAVTLPQVGRPSPGGAWMSVALVTEARALLGDGSEVAALRWHNEAALAAGIVVSGVQLTTVTAGIACAAQRDWAAAEAHFDAALQQACGGCLIAEPSVHYWRADMLLARDEVGDREKARRLLTAAVEGYARFGMPGFERRARRRLVEAEGAGA